MNRFASLVAAATLALLLIAGSAFAQTPGNIAIVSGNGQMICQCSFGPAQFFFQALVVRITDSTGRPVNGAPVTWRTTAIGNFTDVGQLPDTTYTDANGYAYATYTAPTPAPLGSPFLSVRQWNIVATYSSSSVTFTLTQSLEISPSYTGGIGVTPYSVRMFPGGLELYNGVSLTGQVGSTYPTPIKIQVVTYGQQPIPGVGVMIVNDQTADQGPNIKCAGESGAGADTVLTDSNGIATCNAVFSGVPNVNGFASVAVGGAYPAERFLYNDLSQRVSAISTYPGGEGRLVIRATPGAPSAIQLVSGNQQSAQAGAQLGAALIAKVISSSGLGLAGQAVNWTVSPSGSATLGSSQTTTDANGQASNTLRFSSTASGAVTVTATLAGDTTKTVSFTATAIPNVSVTGLQIVSGNNQSAIVNAAFGAPLVVQLNATGGTASGVPVTFTVTGPATLSAATVNTGSTGQAQVNVTAGATAGAVTVTARGSGFSQTFNLTVSPAGPTLTAAGFMNGADFQRAALSPCSVATVVASGLAPGLQQMVSGNFFGPLPYVLANVRLTIGGSNAPIYSVGRNAAGQEQLTFQVPCDVTPGSSVAAVINVGAGSASINVPIQAASPGIFQTLMSDNVNRAVLVRPDGSFVSVQNPARRGENVIAFVTGLGATTPPVVTNSVAAPGTLSAPQGTVVVGMAGGGVPLVSAQLSPDLVGVWLVTFTIPATVNTGNIPFSISVIPPGANNPISSGTTTIPVQ